MTMKHAFSLCLTSLFGFGILSFATACTPRDAAVLQSTKNRVFAERSTPANAIPAVAGAVLDDAEDFLAGCTKMDWKQIEVPDEFTCHLTDPKTKAFVFVSDRQCFKIGTKVKVQIRKKAGETVDGPIRGELKITRIEIKARNLLTQSDAKDAGYETLEELEAQMLSKQVDRYNKGLVTFVYFKDMKLADGITCAAPVEGDATDDTAEGDTGGTNE